MLFSGGGGQSAKPKIVEKRERKYERDEKYEVQDQVFVRWANSIFDEHYQLQEQSTAFMPYHIQQPKELGDVKFLSNFALLINGSVPTLSGNNVYDDVDTILHALVRGNGQEQSTSGVQKTVLTMYWHLAQIYWRRFAPPGARERKMQEALKDWCRSAADPYEDVIVNDFTSSWRDGIALNVLLMSFDKSLVDLESIKPLRGDERIENALNLAKRNFRVPKLILPKEFSSEHLDMKSVVVYLMMLYLGLVNHSSPSSSSTEKSASPKRSKKQSMSSSGPLPPAVEELQQQGRHQSPRGSTGSSGGERGSVGSLSFRKKKTPPGPIAITQTPQQVSPGQPIPVQIYNPQTSHNRSSSGSGSPKAVSTPPASGKFQDSPMSPLAIAHTNAAAQAMITGTAVPQSPTTTSPTFSLPVPSQTAHQMSPLAQPLPQHPPYPIPPYPVSEPPYPLAMQFSGMPQPTQMPSIPQMHQPQPLQLPPVQQAAPTHMSAMPLLTPIQELPEQFVFDQAAQQMVAMSKLVAATLQSPKIPASASLPPKSPSSTVPSSQSTSVTTVIQAPEFDSNEDGNQTHKVENTKKASDDTPPQSSSTVIVSETVPVVPEPRSRKSSSSSQKSSGRNRQNQRKQEEVIKEYELCLEQVLTWLLEAEQELQAMGESDKKPVEGDQLEVVMKQFRDHENFMKSLTESQDSVGKVLHRGHQLSQKIATDEDQSAGILNQLLMVNERWERIRAMAMDRQQLLQNRLNELQRDHLSQVSKWLTEFEGILATRQQENLAETPEACWRQIAEHALIQEQIDSQQPAIQRLSSFIAIVVDPTIMSSSEGTEEENSAAQLETTLQSIGERWMAICEWTEQRAKHLDGLAELSEQYRNQSKQLGDWLQARLSELQLLRSAHHLEKEEEVVEQMRLLHNMESALESEHHSFVQLSQLCSELVLRYEQSKSTASAERIRKNLDTITETWDNIVTRLEEHSQMLVRTGKAKLGAGIAATEAGDKQKQQVSPALMKPSDTPQATSPDLTPDETRQHAKIVDEFVQKVGALEREIKPLVDWAALFVMSSKREDTRQMVQICQKQLKEIKQVEPCVTQLQVELERIHNRQTMGSRHLHVINETFDRFMLQWSQVVGKISDALNALAKPSSSSSDSETEMIMVRLAGWLKSANQVVNEISRLPPEEAQKRLTQIVQQLDEHRRKSLDYLKSVQKQQSKKMPNQRQMEQVNKLEAQFNELAARVGVLASQQKTTPATTSVQMKQASSSEQESPPRWEDGKRPKPDPVQGSSLLGVPRQNVEHSPEPAPHEAESLRLRLELEAMAEQSDLNMPMTHAQTIAPALSTGQSRLDELHTWITIKEEALRQQQATASILPGDVNFLQAEQGRCDQMISEIHDKLRECKDLAESIDTSTPEHSQLISVIGMLEKLLASTQAHRNNVVDSVNKTQLAIHKFVKAEEIADRHKTALDRLRSDSTTDLREIERQLRTLQDSIIEDHNNTKVEAVQYLEEIASIALKCMPKAERREAPLPGSVVADMRSRIAKLETQWKRLTDEVDEHLSCLVKERRKRAGSSLKTQKDLVKELEEAVKASCEATDAETLSEHLDNLERILERLQSAERECDDEGDWSLMDQLPDGRGISGNSGESETDANSLQSMRYKRNTVVPIARERCEALRQAVARCDYFEQALCNCQSWCAHMHHILNLRISSDIHALDVPHEYKQAFETGTLIPQMDKEFAEYDNLIKELDDFIERSKSQWSSSDRLRLQSEHAKSQLAELRVKYNEFKEPVLLNERMDRVQRQLNEIENALDDLTGIQAEKCEYCLVHSRQLFHQLKEELAEQCSELESAKENLIKEGILSETQAVDIGSKVEELQQKRLLLQQRTSLTVDKLERCVNLLEKLDKEHEQVQSFTKTAEEALVNAIAKTSKSGQQSDKGKTHEKVTLGEIRKQVQKVVEAADKSKELEALLRQNSIKLSPTHCEKITERDARINTLKKQMSIWAETIQTSGSEEDNDTQSLLSNVQDLSHELRSKLEAILAIPNLDGAEANRKLDKLRSLRDKFNGAAQKLMVHKGEGKVKEEEAARKKAGQQLADVDALWQEVSKRRPSITTEDDALSFKTAKSSTPPKTEVEPVVTLEEEKQAQLETVPKVILPHLESRELSVDRTNDDLIQYLDFEKFPVYDLQEWEKRLNNLNEWISENKPKLDDLLAVGKRIAEAGRMELETHEALARLDDLIEIVHDIDFKMEEQERLLQEAQSKQKNFDDGVEQTRAFLQQLSSQLDDIGGDFAASAIQHTQAGLMEACGEMRVLQLAADDLHKSMPNATSATSFSAENLALDELNAQLRQIEARVQEALVNALRAQQEAISLNEAEVDRDPRIAAQQIADALSVSSGAGLSLAMDVVETEPEEAYTHNLVGPEDTAESLETSVSVRPPINRVQLHSDNNLEQFYVNLDTIDEYFEQAQREHLPFEGIEEKLEILQGFEVELDRGEQLIQAQQMTMDIAESEHALQRVASLQKQLAQRRRQLEQRRATITGLDEMYSQCEDLIAALGTKWRQLNQHQARTVQSPEDSSKQSENGRNHSPDLDELEASQLELEDQLPPLAVHLQQCANRLESCINQLSTGAKDKFQTRLQQMNMDFNEYSSEVRQRRQNLEERLADQTHLNNQLEMLEFWCDETEANLTGTASILDPQQLDNLVRYVLERHNEMPEKLDAMHSLENLKDRFVALSNVEPDVKHEVRRYVSQLAKRVSDLKMEVHSKLKELEDLKRSSERFWQDVHQIDGWMREALGQLESVQQARIYRPSMVTLEKLAVEGEEHRNNTLDAVQTRLTQEVDCRLGGELNENERNNHKRVQELTKQFDLIAQQINKVLEDNALHSSDSDLDQGIDDLYSKMDAAKAKLKDVQDHRDTVVKSKPQKDAPKDQKESGEATSVPSTEYGTLNSNPDYGAIDRSQNDIGYFQNGFGDSEDQDDKRHPKRRMSVSEQARLDTVTRLRSLLQEIERDIGITVDLADQNVIRQAMSKAQKSTHRL
ncbi:calponin homology (CH) domain-containing protein [Ditylenchus destructor]|nr:calponin homology (CH) domain-containing protein [Ditylenchus destructor]